MKILKNITIGKRLALGFAIMLLFAIIMTGIGIWRLQQVSGATRAMMDVPLAKERMISDWASNIASGIRRSTAIAKSSDESLATFFAAEAKASSEASGILQKKIEALISAEDERALFEDIGKQRKAYLASRDQIMKLRASGNADEASRIFQQAFVPSSGQFLAQMLELQKLQRAKIDNIAVDIERVADTSRNLLLVLAALMTAFGVFASWLLTTGIVAPLRAAVDAARRVASGDLTCPIAFDSRDETGQLLEALCEMNNSLLNIVSSVRRGTDSITTASSEIAAGNQDLSQRTEEQASSLGETASSMEHLTSTVKGNADNARQANQLAVSAAEVAVRGGSVVDQVVGTMESITASSNRIVDIIAVIDGIAFQTNILALNAAVEAARAGEQGRGFAVVASEVRNLAQRSASAAKEIKELISNSVEQVNQGSRLVEQAGTTMKEIVASVHKVGDIVSQIATASNEQTGGIEEVYKAIGQLDAVTQQNAALVEEAAAAAESMQHQAAELAHTVSIFKVDDGLRSRAVALRAA
jgi:methyl-accepting chemotaxis protein